MKTKWSILAVIILSPLLLWATLLILPTHDDWTSLTTPDLRPFFIRERFLFYGYHWRPFDSMIGWVAGRNPQLLYPAFNHVLVILGHIINTLLIFRLTRRLGFNMMAVNVATLFFFLTPATMATVLAVDSQNQTYATTLGLLSFFWYIGEHRFKYTVWIILLFLATLTKENGLMWALICPILAFGFNLTDRKQLRRDLIIGLSIMLTYALIIWLMPKQIIIHPEYVPTPLKVIVSTIKCIFGAFITVDYVWLLHQPSRNLWLAALTFFLALPFMYQVFIRPFNFSILNSCVHAVVNKKPCVGASAQIQKLNVQLSILISLLIAVSPHLLTVFSMMHLYAALPFVALLVANHTKGMILFLYFCLSALIIDVHLWHESYKSGIIGHKMAQEVIHQTDAPVKNVYAIIVEDDYPKLSSFCVIPYDAFGWGAAALYETGYQWPENYQDTIVPSLTDAQQLSKQLLSHHSIDCVWIINHDNVDVIK